MMEFPIGRFAPPRPRACRTCGCTEDRACVVNGLACSWADQDLCSFCAEFLDGPPPEKQA